MARPKVSRKIFPFNPYELKMFVLNQLVKKNILILVAFAAVVTAHADPAPALANTVAPATNSVPVNKYPWVSTVTAGLTLTRGNSDTILFTAKYLTQKKQAQNEWDFGADAAYGEDDSVQNADSLHGFGQFNHLFSQKFYGYANVDALHDGIQDLAYQVTLSPGAGYYFIKTLPTQLSGEIGPGFVTERRGEDDESYASLRLSERLDQKLTETAKLWEKVVILPEVTKFDNYTVNFEAGISTALTKSLSLQVILDDDYVNEPAAGRQKNDVKLVSGIAYKF